MHERLLSILVDPTTKELLELEECRKNDAGRIVEGSLRSQNGSVYLIRNGIPRFDISGDEGQRQTQESFGHKWHRDSFDSPQATAVYREWLVEKYGFQSADDMRLYFGNRQWVMDAGCGSGNASAIWMDETWQANDLAQWCGVDISTAVDVAQERFNGTIPGVHFVQADILQLPFRANTFDIIYSEGVLHHTPSTEQALKILVPLLKHEGEIMFYVYKKKGPIREFSDDYIRDIVSQMGPDTVWEMMRSLTGLAKTLAELKVEVDVLEDIPYLGIKAGRQNIQRLIYWNFIKLYWNEALSFDENNLINFDWYHPRYAFRQTEEDVRRWCEESGLIINHFHAQESGYTVRAIKG